jgi:DNA-nicking Smr family endonuclease
MAGKKDTTSKGLSKGDAELWKAMTTDVKRMAGKRYKAAQKEDQEETPELYERISVKQEKLRRSPSENAKGLDRRTAQRLERGQMEIEATLDLHGFSQAKAEEALAAFIRRGYERGERCVLVITGKGRRGGKDGMVLEPGILKRRVPEWLDGRALKPFILKYHPAKPKHGGNGALYVLLRRKR